MLNSPGAPMRLEVRAVSFHNHLPKGNYPSHLLRDLVSWIGAGSGDSDEAVMEMPNPWQDVFPVLDATMQMNVRVFRYLSFNDPVTLKPGITGMDYDGFLDTDRYPQLGPQHIFLMLAIIC